MNVKGVVSIGKPYFGTYEIGPSLISLTPFSISIQKTLFSILSQYKPIVLCFIAKSSMGLTCVFFTYSFFLLSRFTSQISIAWLRIVSGSLFPIVAEGTSRTAKSLLKLFLPLLPNRFIIGSIQKFSFG